MSNKSTKIQDIEEIATQAHAGADVSEHFTGRFQVKQQVQMAFPFELLQRIDEHCQQQNVTRQNWITMACVAAIQAIETEKISVKANSFE